MVLLFVTILIRQVNEFFERNRFDSQLFLKPLKKFLGVVGPVKRFPLRVRARAGVISTDGKIVRPKIPANDCVPKRPPWCLGRLINL
jgi:hypothetical protein